MNILDIFSNIFEYFQISNYTNVHPVRAELFHADGRTDTTKLIVAFRYVANAPKTHTFCFVAVCTETIQYNTETIQNNTETINTILKQYNTETIQYNTETIQYNTILKQYNTETI